MTKDLLLLCEANDSRLLQMMQSFAQVAELVDALVSGISDRKVVEVRVFSWAPYKNPLAC